jgi:hypothetical protein
MPLGYNDGTGGITTSHIKTVCRELGWGVLKRDGNALLLFPFKIMGNTFPLSDFSQSDPFSGTN